jgi:peptide/nickel transport system substrate-binding protein
MIIKKYTTGRFAGIKDVNVEFKDGLNVVLGSNESGKTTLIEGIHSVLFRPSKIGRKTTEDKEFHSKFMPYPVGDSIDGEIEIEHDGETYTLSKEWGTEASSKLTMPNKVVIKNDLSIKDTLKDVYIYGEGTYSSVFFLKQYYLKEAINRIVENKEATGEISSLLRSTIMELDGVPLEDLEQKIREEIDTLLRRWDVERNYPENNKGINNPYKVGFGQVVESFYAKERIKLEMAKAEEAERKFNEICQEIKKTEEKIEELKTKKEAMEKIEEDVTQRSILEPQIEVLSDYEIKFTTETLDVELLKSFVYPWAAVVPEEDVANLKTKPVGTGAFILEEWVPQQHLTLRRNDNYYGDEVKIETVKLVLIPDATSMMAGFQVGNLDIIPLTGDQVTMVEGNENFKVLSEPMNAVQIMSLNTKNQYLSNEKVRQAMAMAINKEEVIEASMFGYGAKIGSHLPPTSPDYFDTNNIIEYNPEKAKDLLKEAGYGDGFEIDMALPKNYQLHVDAGQVIADQLGKIGIDVNIQLIEWGTWLSEVYGEKNFETTVVGHTGRLDSYAFLSRYKSNSNDYISLTTGEVDELLDRALNELDEGKRKEIYKEIQIILANKIPAIYLQTPHTMFALQKNVEGMEIFPIDIYDFKEVYFTE